MEDLISVILPVYNGEKYLCESVDSVIAQTYQNWELIIVDDCSTDLTSEIAQKYVNLDARIHYYRNEVNLRLPRNLNRGFSLARGEYLTWTSDDNRYKPTALEKMIKKLKSEKAHFVFSSCRIIDEKGKEIEYIMVNKNSPKCLIGSNPVGACFMYTREVYVELGGYDPELALVEDFEYWQRVYTKFGATTIDEILYEYRWHDGTLTSTMKKDIFNKTLEKMLLKNRPLFGSVDAESNYYYYKGLYDCRANIGDVQNPYTIKYRWYSLIYFWQHRVPNKIKRTFKSQ